MPPTDLSAGDDIIRTTTTSLNTLPPEWGLTTIGEQFDVQQGKALSPAARSGRSYRPFLRTSNVLWGRLDLANVDQMDFSEDEAGRLTLRSDDLLVCEGGEVGRTAVWHHEIPNCLYQNHLHRLRAKTPHVHPEFVMYWMQAALLHLGLYGGMANKTTIPNLSGGRLKNLPIPLPKLNEQQAIAGVLTKIQAALQTQHVTIAKLKELKAATMARLFREGLRGEPLKQTEIGEIPKSWKLIRLGKHCEVKSGGTPARDIPAYWGGDIPWVKTSEINYRPITCTSESISRAGLENSSARVFAKGTLLMAMYGQGVTRGKVAFLEIDAATNQACAALFPTDELDRGYLYAFCSHAYDAIRELGHGANQKNLSADLIRQIRLPIPPTLSEQQGIFHVVDSIEKRLLAVDQYAAALRTLFSSLLHSLMTARIRVPATL